MVDQEQPDGPDRESGRRPAGDPAPAAVSITPVPVDEAPPRPRTDEISAIPATPPAVTEPIRTPAFGAAPPVGKPSRIVAKYLFDSEQYCGEWRRHWIYILRWASIGIASPFVLGYLVGLVGRLTVIIIGLLVIWIALLLLVGYKIMDWFVDRFVLTDKRVMTIGGIVTRKVGMMPLARVTDMAYVQSPLGRILNYGTFVLESAGQDQALREIKPLPRPNDLYLLFCQEMYDPGSVSVGKKENGGGD